MERHISATSTRKYAQKLVSLLTRLIGHVKSPLLTTVSSDSVDGYQRVHGVLKINEEMATASSVLFYVERNKKGLAMLVDDVSMKDAGNALPPMQEIPENVNDVATT